MPSTVPNSNAVILHAPNVHQGGGRTLLTALLNGLPPQSHGLCQLDARLDFNQPLASVLEVVRVAPTLVGRWQAERRLASAAKDDSRILCFHSLPPLFRCRGFVSVFVQNRYLISNGELSDFPWKQRVRIAVERQWLRRLASHANEFIVQTETMQQLLQDCLGNDRPVRVLPLVPPELAESATEVPETLLFPNSSRQNRSQPPFEQNGYDFCYIATGEPHKNHETLLQSWIDLALREIRPSLCLTLSPDRFPDLCRKIEAAKQTFGLRISNEGYVSTERIAGIYRESRALVFPSHFESFGLPLLEARQHGLAIVAPELDYVRDVVSPDQTFDPHSPRSLARAIERSLAIGGQPQPLITGSEFYRRLFAA